MTWLGVDIGGANLKAADGQGYAASKAFALWQKPEGLADALRELIGGAPAVERLAVTMTGELADCFRTKAEGVRRIVEAVLVAAEGRDVRVYLTDGRLVPPNAAVDEPLCAAASNWHALAAFSARFVSDDSGLVIDVGSTTTDIVPLVDGRPLAEARTDPERLVAGELVYTGVERSPICAVVSSLPWRQQPCPTAHELFSTTLDAYLLLGELPEDADKTTTADGRPATKEFARERLARAICADREMFDEKDALAAAEAVRRAQLAKLGVAAGRVLARLARRPATVVISGQGEFLARRLIERLRLQARVVSLSDELGAAELSRAATAHAVAVLAAEAEA